VVGGASVVDGVVAADGGVVVVVPASSAEAEAASRPPIRLRTSVRPTAVSPIFFFIPRTGGLCSLGGGPTGSKRAAVLEQ
jgi:hypothetical protein